MGAGLGIPPMTEAERKKRGEKSAVTWSGWSASKLRAMGCDRFDLGIGAMLAR